MTERVPILTILPVGLVVGKKVMEHQFVREAKAVSGILKGGKNVDHGGVIGTENTRRPELYGWHNPVSPHMDNAEHNSWIYGCVLVRGRLTRIGCFDHEAGKIIYIEPEHGDVFRLNDRYLHWTEGSGSSVAIFAGEFDEPCDAHAVELLQRGVNRLANGVRTAPRVKDGFRVMLDTECYATKNFETSHMVSLKLAEKRGWMIAECECGNPATRIDRHWPMDAWGNACRSCSK